MNAHAAYKQIRNLPQTRIDIILSLYRKAMANLERARLALVAGQTDAARPCLLNTQLIVMALSSQLPAYNKNELAVNCFRLYTFVARQMALGGIENVDAAVRVLRPLLEGFEAVREQAVALELQGKIPSLDRDHAVSLTA